MEFNELSIDKTLLFLFSAIGVLNTFLLTLYFSFFSKKRQLHNRFLAALLFVIGLREAKSLVTLFIENDIDALGFLGQFIDTLIGPFLYLYLFTYVSGNKLKRYQWLLHTLSYAMLMLVTFFIIKTYDQPYLDYSGPIGGIIYIQWAVYIILSFKLIKPAIKKLYKKQKLESKELWLVTLLGSVSVIWLAYFITHYSNYILGSVSISVVAYLSAMIWFYQRKSEFHETQPKYGNKKIASEEAKRMLSELESLMTQEALYMSATLKLADVAAKLKISPNLLSQLLNDNLQVSFKHYINEYRIQAATEMIKTNHHLTLEAIGVDCGFKSKSAFYTAFKSILNQTPAQFRKTHISN